MAWREPRSRSARFFRTPLHPQPPVVDSAAVTSVRSIAQDDVVRLVRAHQAEVWRYVRYLGATPELADDLVQEAFLQLLRAPFVERTPAATSAWLRTVVRNLYVKSFRRPPFASADLDAIEATWNGFVGDGDASGDGEASGAPAGGDEALARLRQCLGQLDGRARSVVAWHYEERRSRADIAGRLGIGEDGVKSLLRRTRALLKACVERRAREAGA